jgi:hypothetical protein
LFPTLLTGDHFPREQVRAQGETRQSGNIMHIQAGQQFHAMIFDRLGAYFQDAIYLLGVLALGDEL